MENFIIPEDETLEVRQLDENGVLNFIITRSKYKNEHYLYEVLDNYKIKKIEKQSNPNDFKVLNKFYEKF